MRQKLMSVLAAITVLFGAAACSGAPTTSVALPADTVVIDVRSPEEYAAGHLEGAELLDLNSGQFEQAVSGLDPDASYALYCRSGNRSGQAAQIAKSAGFENVTDLGSIESASKTSGLEIVTD